MQILCRKKKFPFPIKLHGENITGKKIAGNIHAAVKDCTHALIGGGHEFQVAVSKTESIDIKGSVKNIL